jgi:REP element-mobilizing transposase RayT
MTQPRTSLVCLEDTPYYHITTRCVRRAFLCGIDHYTGKSFDHRKTWIRDRIGFLESVFAIDIAAYAVMSNHCHIVVRLHRLEDIQWSDQEVVERWQRIFTLPVLVEEWKRGIEQPDAVQFHVKTLIQKWKTRLCDLGWFMRCLNEYIARKANAEDKCTGRFWEGRYKSQALLDETALLMCMTYIDLNPIRAGMAKTPEESELTSIQERIQKTKIVRLLSLDPTQNGTLQNLVPIDLPDYLELVDWTGRAVLENKRGVIPEKLPRILTRLGIEETAWISTMNGGYTRYFNRAVGAKEKMQSVCERLKQQWLCGVNALGGLYPT